MRLTSGLVLRLKKTGHRETKDRKMWGVYELGWTAGGRVGKLTILAQKPRSFHWYAEVVVPGGVLQLLGRHPRGVKARIRRGVPRARFKENRVMAVIAGLIGVKNILRLGTISTTHQEGAYRVEAHGQDGHVTLRMVIGAVTGAVLYRWLPAKRDGPETRKRPTRPPPVRPAARARSAAAGRWISRAEVIRRSRTIFTARILKVDNRPEKAPFDPTTRWVAFFRVLVRVQRVLKGKWQLHREVPRPDELWLEQQNPSIPGVRVGRRREYRSTYQLKRARRGDRILAYLGPSYGVRKQGPLYRISLGWVDHIRIARAVRRSLRKATAVRQQSWRKQARCKAFTYFFRRRCRKLAAIRQQVRCPPGSAAVDYPARGRPLVRCRRRADGKPHGPSFTWHRNGELQTLILFWQGKLHGRLQRFDDQRRLVATSCYEQGRVRWETRSPKEGRTRRCPPK